MAGIHDDPTTCARLRAFKTPRIDTLRGKLGAMRASELLYLWLDPQGQRELAGMVLEPRKKTAGLFPPPPGSTGLSETELETLGAAMLAIEDEIDLRQPPRDTSTATTTAPSPSANGGSGLTPTWRGKP